MRMTRERIEILAAEYVLGSLHGQARRRFERWMMESGRVRQEVWFWEQKLGQLSAEVQPVEPPKSVWQAIERRLWPQAAESGKRARSGLSWLWPSWSLLATAAAVMLAVLIVQQPAPSPQLSGAIVQADVSDPLWLVSESGPDRLLKLRSIAASAADAGKDYELWIVPEQGQPLSLGVIPAGGVHQVTLTDEARTALSQSRTWRSAWSPWAARRRVPPPVQFCT